MKITTHRLPRFLTVQFMQDNKNATIAVTLCFCFRYVSLQIVTIVCPRYLIFFDNFISPGTNINSESGIDNTEYKLIGNNVSNISSNKHVVVIIVTVVETMES
jgi:hypothetical protein